MATEELRLLRSVYTQQDPPLLDVVERMVNEVVGYCQSTLSSEPEALAHIVTSLAGVQRALMEELKDEVTKGNLIAQQISDRVIELGLQLNRLVEEASSTRGQAGPTSSPAFSLPSDEHYRVLTGPNLRNWADGSPRKKWWVLVGRWVSAVEAASARACWRCTTPGRPTLKKPSTFP